MRRIAKIILNFIKHGRRTSRFYERKHAHMSYSQQGEDLILRRFFGSKSKGFYIDIGAHHPKRFSNTYILYKSGWSGINVDATPGSMKLFNKERRNDINLEVGISDKSNTMSFYIFDESALNTALKERAEYLTNNTGYKLQNTIIINTLTLSALLEKYLPANQKIDFLSVDVEGLDLEILKTNNWDTFRPHVILVEDFELSKGYFKESEICIYLGSKHYEIFSKAFNTLFFKDLLQK